MEPQTPEVQPAEVINNREEKESFLAPAHKVTTFSKVLAAVLFIALPFVGFYLGYISAPEKVVDINIESNLPVNEDELDFNKPDVSVNSNLLCTRDEVFPEAKNFEVGIKYGDFTFSTSTFVNNAAKNSAGESVCASGLEMKFTGTSTLLGHIVVRPEELSGSGDSNDGIIVSFELDEASKEKLPNWGDMQGVFSKRALTVEGLRTHPYVIDAISNCTPNEYCNDLNKLSPHAVTLVVKGYSFSDLEPGGHGHIPYTTLVSFEE